MPKITVPVTPGDGWQPLPSGSYQIQIDAVDANKTSQKNNPQMMLTGHVHDGPHAGKKCTIWYVLIAKSGFRTKALVEATGIDYEEVETDTVDEETGKKLTNISFDPEELVGCVLWYTVSQREYQGKQQNQFSDERPLQQAAAPASGASTTAAPAAAAAAAPTAAPGAVRRTRTAGGIQ